MRILYWPQISMRSYQDNRWLFSSDAQITKMRAYVNSLPQDWQWTWVIPRARQLDRSWESALPLGVQPVHMTWGDNVLHGRYYFPLREVFKLFEIQQFDVMLLEVPELARAVRVAQSWVKRDFPIVAMVEHVDIYEETRVPERVAYHLRQVDGALCSDVLAFPLAGMWHEWAKAADDLVRPRVYTLFQEKAVIWDALYDPEEVLAWRLPGSTGDQDETPVVFFISRLSDNQRTHYEEFFEANRILSKEREYKVIVANPNEAKSADWISRQGDNVHYYGTLTRSGYIRHLWDADVVPILYPQSHIYSLGFCEAITAGNVILTVDSTTEYLDETVGVRIPSATGPEEVAFGLRMALDVAAHPDLRRNQLDMQERWLLERRSVTRNIDRVRETIEGVAG